MKVSKCFTKRYLIYLQSIYFLIILYRQIAKISSISPVRELHRRLCQDKTARIGGFLNVPIHFYGLVSHLLFGPKPLSFSSVLP